jgi:hypothetical protein
MPAQETSYTTLEEFADKVFATNRVKKGLRLLRDDYYFDILFSDPLIETSFSQWLLANREAIFQANKAYFGTYLKGKSDNICSINQVYDLSTKQIINAVVLLQLYINYAKNPVNDFATYFKVSNETLTLINSAKQGMYSNIDLFNYL